MKSVCRNIKSQIVIQTNCSYKLKQVTKNPNNELVARYLKRT